jgi:all-trans-retinol 13,14-reductase
MNKDKKHIVIIGSGMGGLVCGLILLKKGYDVTILEKNRQFGGNLQIFSRDKRIFDTGVHYIGGLDEGQNLNTLFKYFGIMDKLKLRKCDEDGYDLITYEHDDELYFHAQGYENFIKILLQQFPEEEAGIRKYVDKIKSVCSEFPIYFLNPTDGNIVQSESIEISAKEFINSCTKNEKLQNVLAGTNLLYASTSDKTPLYVHALIINSYLESAYKCIDGGAQIEKEMSKQIKALGGKMLKYKNVTSLVCNEESGLLEYAETSEGDKIYGDTFISNIHPSNTLNILKNSQIRNAYRNRIDSLENTISTFILSVVLEENKFKYQNYNHYHHISNNSWDTIDKYDEMEWPNGFAVFCPPNSKNPDYADCLTIMAYMRIDELNEWRDTFHTIPNFNDERGESYQEFKRKKSELLLDAVEKKYPGLRDIIISHSASTPLTYRDYIGTNDGSLYGIVKDYKEPLKSFIPPRTKVSNLLLTGQNLNLHGILGVTIAALVTCSQLTDLKTLLEEINNSKN